VPDPLQENQIELFEALMVLPENFQRALLARLVEDPENSSRDSAMILCVETAKLLNAQRNLEKFIEQGSYQHASALARLSSSITNNLKEINAYMEQHAQEGSTRTEPTYDPNSAEFNNAFWVMQQADRAAVWNTETETETVEERLAAIDDLASMDIKELERLDAIERKANITHTVSGED
jgi:hypothetical protein